MASQDCRAARALDDPRGLATSADGSRLYAAGALSDGVAVLGPQVAPNCLPVRAKTVANKARSVVLACSDPNGDPVTLTILRKPRHGRVGGLVKATGSILYTPAPGYAGSDSFTYTATDGLDTSALGTAVIAVTLPAEGAGRQDPHGSHAPAPRRPHPRPRGVPADRHRPLPGRGAPARQRAQRGLRVLAAPALAPRAAWSRAPTA